MTCCNWDHVRPCGRVPLNTDEEPICICGCSAFDDRCGESEWWLPEPGSLDAAVAHRAGVLDQKWKDRIDGVKLIGEPHIFVTMDEWDEIRELADWHEANEPPEVKARREHEKFLMSGAIGDFLATPVVVNGAEAFDQITRIGAARR